MTDIIIGIDPGFKGGIAVLKGDTLLVADKVPVIKSKSKTRFDIPEMIKLVKSAKKHGEVTAFIEKVSAMPKQGVTSMFNFGKGYGMWLGILATLEIPYYEVTPQEWKKNVLNGTDKSKEAGIAFVKQLFPNVNLKPGRMIKCHDGISDAVCISIYGGMRLWK